MQKDRIYCECSEDFKRRAKLAALQQGRPLGNFAYRAIEAKVLAHERKPMAKPVVESKYAPADAVERAWVEKLVRQLRRKERHPLLRLMAEIWKLPLPPTRSS
jgi:hypothetical protein